MKVLIDFNLLTKSSNECVYVNLWEIRKAPDAENILFEQKTGICDFNKSKSQWKHFTFS